MSFQIKTIMTFVLLVVSLNTMAAEIKKEDIQGVWEITKMTMSGHEIPGSGDTIEFTKDGKMNTTSGKVTFSDPYRLSGNSVYVKTMAGEAEHKITSFTGSTMQFNLPDGIVYDMVKKP